VDQSIYEASATLNARRNIHARKETDFPIRVCVSAVREGARVRSETLKAFCHRVTGIEIVPLAVKIH
jgi:hypothetical protein